jgi:hypothetical protein
MPAPWRTMARWGWFLIAAPSAAALFLSAAPRYRQLSTVSENPMTIAGQLLPGEADALADLGITPQSYGLYFTGLELIVGLVFVGIGAYIFLGRSQGRVSWLFSMAMTTFGLIASPMTTGLAASNPGWDALILVLRNVGFANIVVGFMVFPDGRFFPRWTRWLAVILILYLLASLALPALRIIPSLAISGQSQLVLAGWAMFWFVFAAGVQVYRYRAYLNQVARQQAKWVVLGLATCMGLSAISAGLMALLYLTHQPLQIVLASRLVAFSVVLITEVFLGVSVAMAILRHRLWDIDLIIRRTLAYTLISGILAGVYFTTVIILQTGFNLLTGQDSPLAVALSTLAIAALFNPLRGRIQRLLARRFDRHAYDARQALEKFGASMQHEVDLNQILGSLGTVLSESLGPEQVSIWLMQLEKGESENA